MQTVSFLTKTSSGPKTGSRTESRDPLRGVSYTVGAGEATVVCCGVLEVSVGERGRGCWGLGSAARSEPGVPGEDLEELKLVGFVPMSGDFGVGRVRKRERR